MNMYTKLAAAAAVVLVVGFAGYQLLPRDGGPGGPGGPSIAPSPTPSIAPSPTPAFLARGTFKAKGADVVLDARGRGSDVTGTMSVSYGGGDFTVDLECSRTTASGLLWIGGDVTESTDTELGIKGTRTAIVFKPGSPVRAVFIFQLDDPDSASCQAFFDDMIAIGGEPRPGPDGLEPIEGTVELAP